MQIPSVKSLQQNLEEVKIAEHQYQFPSGTQTMDAEMVWRLED